MCIGLGSDQKSLPDGNSTCVVLFFFTISYYDRWKLKRVKSFGNQFLGSHNSKCLSGYSWFLEIKKRLFIFSVCCIWCLHLKFFYIFHTSSMCIEKRLSYFTLLLWFVIDAITRMIKTNGLIVFELNSISSPKLAKIWIENISSSNIKKLL